MVLGWRCASFCLCYGHFDFNLGLIGEGMDVLKGFYMHFPLSAELTLLLIGFIQTEKRNFVIVPASVNVSCPMKPWFNDYVLQEDGGRQSKGEMLERCHCVKILE